MKLEKNMTSIYEYDVDLEVTIKSEPGITFKIDETKRTYMKFLWDPRCKPLQAKHRKAKRWEPFYEKLYYFLLEKDFELPPLNRQEFDTRNMTIKLPSKKDMETMKEQIEAEKEMYPDEDDDI